MLLKKKEHQKKGALKQKIEAFLYTLYWRFKKIPFKLYSYVLAKILQNRARFIQKLTPGFKNHLRNLENFRQALEGPKSCNLMGYFCPKNTFLILIPNTSHSYVISPVIFETISHFSRQNSSAFFSSNITSFLQKKSIKVQFSDFLLLGLKFPKFLLFFQTKS